MKNGISAVLIVKNEEKVLRRCLESLSGMDEIIVLDTGSTDRTMEIAREFTDQVGQAPPADPFHFANARNMADKMARQDWILTIDADEVLSKGSFWDVKRAARRYPQAIGWKVTFGFSGANGENPTSMPKLKIFRRGAFTWRYRVHEQLIQLKAGEILELPQVEMEHHPDLEKAHRHRQNLDLLKISVEEDPEYLRNWRQLGMESFVAGLFDEAIPHLERYLAAKGIDHKERSETYIHLARAHASMGRLDEALLNYDRACQSSPGRREPYMYKALALIKVALLDDAIIELEKCLKIDSRFKPDFHLNVESIWDGSLPREALAFCQGEIARAKERLQKA